MLVINYPLSYYQNRFVRVKYVNPSYGSSFKILLVIKSYPAAFLGFKLLIIVSITFNLHTYQLNNNRKTRTKKKPNSINYKNFLFKLLFAVLKLNSTS